MLTAVHSHDTRLHEPKGEVWVGVEIAGTEVPERVDALERALVAAGATMIRANAGDRSDLHRVHDPAMVEFLATAFHRWAESGYPTDPGQGRVVPYAFPLRQMTSGRPPHRPASIGAETGMWAMDTMTLIGRGSWEAIEAAAFCALTAADLLERGPVYALCRPPGHHAGRDFYGGSCYLNNAALAAQRLRDRGAGTVAVIDVDAHHGNGTQEIFYERADIRYGSVHVDPGEGWFPHFVGYADEVGAGPGKRANLNLPMAPGTGDDGWVAGVDRLVDFAAGSDAVVVSLGVDAAAGDPESPLEITADGYRQAGAVVAGLGVPTVIVQEGGYDLHTLGDLVVSFLTGLTHPRG